MAPPAPLDLTPSYYWHSSEPRQQHCVPALLPSALTSRKAGAALGLPQLLLLEQQLPCSAARTAGGPVLDHVAPSTPPPQCGASGSAAADEDALITNMSAFAVEVGGALLLSAPASPVRPLLLCGPSSPSSEDLDEDLLALLTPSPSPLCGLFGCPNSPAPMACGDVVGCHVGGEVDWEALLLPPEGDVAGPPPASPRCGVASDSTSGSNDSNNGTHPTAARCAWPSASSSSSPAPAPETSRQAGKALHQEDALAAATATKCSGGSLEALTASNANNDAGSAAQQQEQQQQAPLVHHLRRTCVLRRPQLLGASRVWAAAPTPVTAAKQQQQATVVTGHASGASAPGSLSTPGKPPLPPSAAAAVSSSRRLVAAKRKAAAAEGGAPSAKRRAA